MHFSSSVLYGQTQAAAQVCAEALLAEVTSGRAAAEASAGTATPDMLAVLPLQQLTLLVAQLLPRWCRRQAHTTLRHAAAVPPEAQLDCKKLEGWSHVVLQCFSAAELVREVHFDQVRKGMRRAAAAMIISLQTVAAPAGRCH